jgi:hypothetical protein
MYNPSMARKRKRSTRASSEPPTSSCLLICDDVLQSTATGKRIFHGIIDLIVVSSMPADIGPFAAYIRLSNVYGSQRILINLINAATDQEVFRFEAQSPVQSDPLATHTLILRIERFAVCEPGRYIFSASHAGVPFAQSPIIIRTAETEIPAGEREE